MVPNLRFSTADRQDFSRAAKVLLENATPAGWTGAPLSVWRRGGWTTRLGADGTQEALALWHHRAALEGKWCVGVVYDDWPDMATVDIDGHTSATALTLEERRRRVLRALGGHGVTWRTGPFGGYHVDVHLDRRVDATELRAAIVEALATEGLAVDRDVEVRPDGAKQCRLFGGPGSRVVVSEDEESDIYREHESREEVAIRDAYHLDRAPLGWRWTAHRDACMGFGCRNNWPMLSGQRACVICPFRPCDEHANHGPVARCVGCRRMAAAYWRGVRRDEAAPLRPVLEVDPIEQAYLYASRVTRVAPRDLFGRDLASRPRLHEQIASAFLALGRGDRAFEAPRAARVLRGKAIAYDGEIVNGRPTALAPIAKLRGAEVVLHEDAPPQNRDNALTRVVYVLRTVIGLGQAEMEAAVDEWLARTGLAAEPGYAKTAAVKIRYVMKSRHAVTHPRATLAEVIDVINGGSFANATTGAPERLVNMRRARGLRALYGRDWRSHEAERLRTLYPAEFRAVSYQIGYQLAHHSRGGSTERTRVLALALSLLEAQSEARQLGALRLAVPARALKQYLPSGQTRWARSIIVAAGILGPAVRTPDQAQHIPDGPRNRVKPRRLAASYRL